MKRLTYQAGLDKLIEWIENKNWDVFIGHFQDEMDTFERSITINNLLKIENKLYRCLHECGHLLLLKNKNYKMNYPYIHKVDSLSHKNNRFRNTKMYQVELIAEEIEAWKKGKLLAKRLGIYINDENYNKEMCRCVFTYIK